MELEPLAQIPIVKIARLDEGDSEEAAKLYRAAQEDGICYIDLRDGAYDDLIEAVDNVLAFSKALFGLNEKEKMRYDVDKLSKLKLNGYPACIPVKCIECPDDSCLAISRSAVMLAVSFRGSLPDAPKVLI